MKYLLSSVANVSLPSAIHSSPYIRRRGGGGCFSPISQSSFSSSSSPSHAISRYFAQGFAELLSPLNQFLIADPKKSLCLAAGLNARGNAGGGGGVEGYGDAMELEGPSSSFSFYSDILSNATKMTSSSLCMLPSNQSSCLIGICPSHDLSFSSSSSPSSPLLLRHSSD
ncbi:hypothetical protein CSUI_010769, partial [Cystoisospora suis]